MSDDEDYRSSEDEEYVPTVGEEVSEEENSGDEENLDALKEDGESAPLGKRKRKSSKKSPKKASGPWKRTGGIKLEGDTATAATEENDGVNKELVEQIKFEQEQKKEVQEKKRADDLWSSFMSDVGKPPAKKPAATCSGLASLSSVRKLATTESKTPLSTSLPTSTISKTGSSAASSKIVVTKEYDFAGEAVKVTKELDVNSKEGQEELKRQQEEKTESDSPIVKPAAVGASGGVKRLSGGLGGVLDKINKKPKIGTLQIPYLQNEFKFTGKVEKSKLDWDHFKKKEGIDEELKIHNRGKESYIERMQFLQRTDVRQFEIEKSLRLSASSKR